MPLIRAAVQSFDRETGGLLHLPYHGGVLEQPFRTMQAFEVVQVVFGERLKEEYSKGGKNKS